MINSYSFRETMSFWRPLRSIVTIVMVLIGIAVNGFIFTSNFTIALIVGPSFII
jgi:hypothetical protein